MAGWSSLLKVQCLLLWEADIAFPRSADNLPGECGKNAAGTWS